MKDHAHKFTVMKMCKVFGVSSSGYYKWRSRPDKKQVKRGDLDALIQYEHERSRGTYGSPRITQMLNKDEYRCSKSTVARCMKRMNIVAREKKKYRLTTDSRHGYKTFNNLLNREFEQDTIGKVWVSDITYVRVLGQWTYLTVVIDLADRMVLGWSLSKDLTTKNTIIKAFYKALSFRQPKQGFMFHSDRGVQYASHDFTRLIKSLSGVQSMSRKGNCWDNAVAESFFKTIKVECIYKTKIKNFIMAENLIFDYIQGWYNTSRIHSALAGLTPLETFINKSNYFYAA